jgi:hypothetical protein
VVSKRPPFKCFELHSLKIPVCRCYRQGIWLTIMSSGGQLGSRDVGKRSVICLGELLAKEETQSLAQRQCTPDNRSSGA